MRKTLAIFQASPRRLLTQLLITLLLFSVLVASSGMKRCVKQKVAPEDITTKAQFKLNKANIKACSKDGLSKPVRLQSLSSHKFITIKPTKGRKVTAKSRFSRNIYTYVMMTSYDCNGSTIVRLKGIIRGNSLCFNKRGKLIQKEDASLGVRCAFREFPVPGRPTRRTIELRSALDPNLLIAFNEKGRSIRGGRYSGKCNHFETSEDLPMSRRQLKIEKKKRNESGVKSRNGSNSKSSGGYSNRRRNRNGSQSKSKWRNSRASKKSRRKKLRRVIGSTNSSREKIRHMKHKRTRTEDRTDR